MCDLNAATFSLDFLETYCGVIYDNEDTGAITGSDAGSSTTKTAQNVIPEKIPVEDWKVPDVGSTTTIKGLTVHFPKIGASGTLTDAEKYILAGLNSVLIKQSLDLIEESYGLNFTAEDVSVRDISVVFIDDENSHTTASTFYSYGAVYTVTSLQLIINMKYFKDIDLTSEDGLLIPSSPYYDAAGYLDRTLAHKLIHTVMAVNIKSFALLSTVINKGLAELVHGIDDLRGYTSSGGGDLAAFVSSGEVEDLLIDDYSPSDNNAYYYVAGYLLLRYLAKQGQKFFPPLRIISNNLA